METRKHIHEESFAVSPEEMFDMLLKPSAICGWWQASRAIVLPGRDGFWTAAWGDEDDPDYISSFKIANYDPPCRLLLTDSKYYSKEGELPFEAEITAEFVIEPLGGGCLLRVIQDGFPADPSVDDFYNACETGWKNTFAGIRRYLDEDRKIG